MNLTITQHDSASLIQLEGSLTVKSVDGFRQEVSDMLASNTDCSRLIFDLEQLDMVDSSGLGGLLAIYKTMKDRGGVMQLANLQRKARMVFEITRAHELFDIFDSAEDALAAAG